MKVKKWSGEKMNLKKIVICKKQMSKLNEEKAKQIKPNHSGANICSKKLQWQQGSGFRASSIHLASVSPTLIAKGIL